MSRESHGSILGPELVGAGSISILGIELNNVWGLLISIMNCMVAIHRFSMVQIIQSHGTKCSAGQKYIFV